MKDMRDMTNAAPAMVAQAQQLGAQARQMAAAQQAAMQAQMMQAGGMQAGGMQAGGSALRRSVTIVGMRQIGMMNFDLLVEFDLTVLPDNSAPYAATTQQRVSQMQIGRLRPGMTLPAAVAAYNPAAIWLDLSGLA